MNEAEDIQNGLMDHGANPLLDSELDGVRTSQAHGEENQALAVAQEWQCACNPDFSIGAEELFLDHARWLMGRDDQRLLRKAQIGVEHASQRPRSCLWVGTTYAHKHGSQSSHERPTGETAASQFLRSRKPIITGQIGGGGQMGLVEWPPVLSAAPTVWCGDQQWSPDERKHPTAKGPCQGTGEGTYSRCSSCNGSTSCVTRGGDGRDASGKRQGCSPCYGTGDCKQCSKDGLEFTPA